MGYDASVMKKELEGGWFLKWRLSKRKRSVTFLKKTSRVMVGEREKGDQEGWGQNTLKQGKAIFKNCTVSGIMKNRRAFGGECVTK